MNPNAIPFEPQCQTQGPSQGPMFMRPMPHMGPPNNCMVRPMGPHNHILPPICFQPMPPMGHPNHMMAQPMVHQCPMPPMGYCPIGQQLPMENHYRGKQPPRLAIPPNRASPSRSKTPIEECQENKLSPDSRLWKWVSWAILGSKNNKKYWWRIFIIYFLIILDATLSVEKKTMTIPKSASADDKAAYYAHLRDVYLKSGRSESSFVRNGIRAQQIDEALRSMNRQKPRSSLLKKQDTMVWMDQREIELGKGI